MLALALEKNQTLRLLKVHGNKIGVAGARELALALKVNQTLQSLDLWSNKLGDEGAQVLALALEENQTLQSLNLAGNKIRLAGIQKLASALKENQTLQLLKLDSHRIGDAEVRELALALKENHTLQSLDLPNTDQFKNLLLALRANAIIKDAEGEFSQQDEAAIADILEIEYFEKVRLLSSISEDHSQLIDNALDILKSGSTEQKEIAEKFLAFCEESPLPSKPKSAASTANSHEEATEIKRVEHEDGALSEEENSAIETSAIVQEESIELKLSGDCDPVNDDF